MRAVLFGLATMLAQHTAGRRGKSHIQVYFGADATLFGHGPALELFCGTFGPPKSDKQLRARLISLNRITRAAITLPYELRHNVYQAYPVAQQSSFNESESESPPCLMHVQNKDFTDLLKLPHEGWCRLPRGSPKSFLLCGPEPA